MNVIIKQLEYHICRKYLDEQDWKNSANPDQVPKNAMFDQGLYCLLIIQQFLDTSTGTCSEMDIQILGYYGKVFKCPYI